MACMVCLAFFALIVPVAIFLAVMVELQKSREKDK